MATALLHNHSLANSCLHQGGFEDSEKVKILEEENARLQRQILDNRMQYHREQALLLSLIHAEGMKSVRTHMGNQSQLARPNTTSWLSTQRKNVGPFKGNTNSLNLLFLLHSLDRRYGDDMTMIPKAILISWIPDEIPLFVQASSSESYPTQDCRISWISTHCLVYIVYLYPITRYCSRS